MLLFYFFKYMLLHIRKILKIQKKIPCRIYKVTTGVYVTPPPFRLIRKHHSYANYNKKNYFCCHIYMLLHIRKMD